MGKRAFEVQGFRVPGLVAAADLSAKQYCWVKLTEINQVSAIAADTDQPFGVLQNAPTAGQAAEVMVTGVSYVVAGGTIDASANANVGPSATGTAVARVTGTDATRYRAGIALSDAASGDVIPVLLITPLFAVTAN